jgi:WS/DGAT/MGAT family acyltransferase
MEDPTNLMMITGLFLFPERLDAARLRATLEERLLRFDRFRQRARSRGAARPVWEGDPAFALDHHLVPCRLPPPADQKTLLDLVSELMSQPLDRERPLWQLHLVENLREGSALVARLHHAIADGMALMRVLMSLTDEVPGTGNGPVPSPPGPGARRALVGEGLTVGPRVMLDLARKHVEAAAELGRLLLDSEPPTPFKGRLGRAKRAAVSRPIPLEAVKALRHGPQATVNDVLLAALTGGLRGYLVQRGTPLPENLCLRAVVPVDLRRSDEEDLGNRFGMVFVPLPVGLSDPRQRLAEVKRRMDHLKSSPQAVVVFGLLTAVGAAPAELQQRVVDLFGSKATAVVTNVPGPRQTLYLAGSPIQSLMFWVPQSGRLGLGVSILSYNGQVRVGVACDAGLVPDPQSLVARFEESFDEMAAALSS